MPLIFLVSLLALANSAPAGSYTWTNNYHWSMLWDDAENWDPPGVPGAADEAVINPPPERGPAIDNDTEIGAIHGPVWDSDSNQVIDIIGGVIVVDHEWLWCNSGSGTGTINISGSPDITITGQFGGIHSGTGILNISDNAAVTSNNEWRMVDGNSATGKFNISGNANVTVHERVRLADDGLAILNISGEPNIIIDGDLTAGQNSGGRLEAYISGGSLRVGGSFQIGSNGSGIIDVNGGTVNCRILKLQAGPEDATGTFNMSGGSVYVEESVRICDGSGTATMNMSGGDVNTNELWLPGGTGTGILNMTGGLLTVRRAVLAPSEAGGTSVINLNGGVIRCGEFAPAGGYSMNIEEGVLIINGDVRGAIGADIDAGYITAYGRCAGRGDVKVDFDNVNPGRTTVWAEPVFERAWNPDPGCEAEYVPREVVLSWSPGNSAIEHHIFFGTNFDDVSNGNLNVYKGGQSDTTYNAGRLSYGVTYYWRIDELSESTYTQGLVWSFTLGDIIVVDEMESYNNTDNKIDDTWLDGFKNSTGSSIWLEPTNAHGGAQSMMYVYDNSVNWGAGPYSEIERQYGETRDWTASGVKAMSLWFYGDPNNDAGTSEQMYVALEDSSNSVSVELYDGDMNDIKIAEWQEWNIELQDFNDGGVDLTNIKKMYIGFGDRYNVNWGGWGTVYFDDIILYPRRCISKYGPAGDVNGDCLVDGADLKIMADEWLKSGDVTADLSSDNKVNFIDQAILAGHWLERKLWPPQ